MHLSVTEAKAQLTELVRRAETGEDVILTRHGHPAVRLVAITKPSTQAARRALLDSLRASAPEATPGSNAARSQDFLYGDDGLPG